MCSKIGLVYSETVSLNEPANKFTSNNISDSDQLISQTLDKEKIAAHDEEDEDEDDY